MVGIDEPAAICLPGQLEDRLIQGNPVEVDRNIEVVLYRETGLEVLAG